MEAAKDPSPSLGRRTGRKEAGVSFFLYATPWALSLATKWMIKSPNRPNSTRSRGLGLQLGIHVSQRGWIPSRGRRPYVRVETDSSLAFWGRERDRCSFSSSGTDGLLPVDSNICPQLEDDGFDNLLYGRAGSQLQQPPTMNEDCLNLNIFARGLRRERHKLPSDPFYETANYRRLSVPGGVPVMVFPAAESFSHGSNGHFMLDATAIVEKFAVIVVTVNIRLNLFGFLASEHLTDPENRGTGNYGLLDFEAALDWVRHSIADFGGDPARITAFGSAAGSACIHYLMLYGRKGMFDRVILQNGTIGSSPPKSMSKARRIFDALCRILDIPRGDGAASARAIRSLSTDSLINALARLKKEEPDLYATAWYPTFDGVLISRDYRQLEMAGTMNATVAQAIIGSCEMGGALYYKQAAETLLHSLFGSKRASEDLPRLFSESLFGEPSDFTARYLAANTNVHVAKYSWKKLLRRTELLGHAGSHHAMELAFVFLSSLLAPSEREIAMEIVKKWTDFAATGETWGQFTADRPNVLVVSDQGATVELDAKNPEERHEVRHRALIRGARIAQSMKL